MPFLIFENGPDKGRKFELAADITYTAGTDPRCDITVRDELVAPLHFRIKGVKGTFFLRTEKPEAATRINDETVEQAPLTSGDKIEVGSTVLSFAESTAENGFIGMEIGGYRILDHLGRGGMGRVFRALQVSLNREVALKVLSPRLTRDPAFVKKFAEEARAAAALTHPNVIQVYDVGSDRNLHYLSMEYAEVGTVEDLINRGDPIPVQRAIAIILDAARGLLYAESKGLVHHDIKPQNLMIDKFQVAKIADMGLASSIEGSGGVNNEIAGTPHFISPERIRRQELDIRSDIYSLGCTFYRILTGKTPFSGDSTREILRKQLKEEPAPVRELRHDVPERVCQVIERMMRKQPADRYANVAALIADLEALLEKKSSKGLIAAAVIAVAAAAVAAAVLLTGGGDKPELDPAAATAEAAEPDEDLLNAFATQEKKVVELQANNELLSIPAHLEPAERLVRLEEIAARYAGTEAAATAASEAEVLRQQTALDAQRAAERQSRIASLRSESEARIAGLLKEGRLSAAMAEAQAVGTGGDLAEDQAVAAIRQERIDSVRGAASSYVEALLRDAGDLAERKEFAAARDLISTGIAALSPSDQGAGSVAAPDPFFVERRNELEAAAHKIEAARRTERAAQLDADLAAVRAWSDPEEEHRAILQLRLGPPPAAPQLFTPVYAGLVAGVAEKLRAEHELVERLKGAVASGTLERNTIDVPDRSETCTILGLTEDGAGLRLSVSGLSLLTKPLEEFSDPEAFASLLQDRFEMSGRDRLDLARALLLIGAARAAAGLDPLRDAIKSYDPEKGWTEPLRQAAEATPLPELGCIAEIESLLGAAAQADPQLESECGALLASARREKAAMETLAAALQPFRDKDPGLKFRDGIEHLQAFATEYTDTLFFRYAGDLAGGSRREGGHLVEFEL